MFTIIYLVIMTIAFLIITIATISTQEYVVSVLIGFLFLLFSYMTFVYTTDYLQKSSPKVVYQTSSYKVFEYTCDEKFW